VASIILLFIQKNEGFLYTDLIAKVTFWAFIVIIIAIFVSIPALSFLGEEYRYIEYGVVPVGISISLLIASSDVYVWLVSFVCVFMSFLALFKLKRHLYYSKALVDPDDILSYRSLRDYSLSNLLVFPHTRTLEVSYFTKLHVIHPVRREKRFNSDSEYLDSLLNTYGVRCVLKFKGTDPYQLFAKLTDMVSMKKILDFKNFELYELSPKKTT
jgi:heme/copper-type cytochrome/quinol oxidase subunit 1